MSSVIAGKLGVDRSGPGGPGASAAGSRKGDRDRDTAGRTKIDESKLDSVGSSSLSGGGAAGSYVPLLAILAVATLAIIGWVAFNDTGTASRIGVFARMGALGLIMALLVFAGSSKALAAQPSSQPPPNFFGMMSIGPIGPEDGQRMVDGGVATFRMPFSWDQVQANPDAEYNWISVDPSVAAAAQARLRVLPILLGTPSGFANRTTVLPVRNAKQRRGWAAFLRAVVARYGPNGEFWAENPELPRLPIRTWQIWNEANFHYFSAPVSPAKYAQLLKQSARVIRSADAKAKIMLSGLYGSPRTIPGKAMKSFDFLRRLYRLNTRRFFDSVAIHPYTPNNPQLKLLLRKVRATMNRSGGRATPIHVTEIGWGSDRRTIFGMGNKVKQAQQLRKGFRLMLKMRRQLKLRSVYWFAWKDVPSHEVTCNFCYASGLFEHGEPLRPKNAWNAFVKFTGGKR